VILWFERRFSKQNNAIRQKSNILAPKKFWAGYTTAHFYDFLKYGHVCMRSNTEGNIRFIFLSFTEGKNAN